MFTGIIQTIGRLGKVEHRRGGSVLTINARLAGRAISRGESIAVDGVCLTVETADRTWFRVRAAPETLRQTTVGSFRAGRAVNLERSLRPSDRIGGHFVFGHVDGAATLKDIIPDGEGSLYTFAAPPPLMRYLVEKGSVALNGVSLTVFSCTVRSFTVSLIPHTLRHTTLGSLRPGDPLNLETDMLARYVARCLDWSIRGQTARRTAPSSAVSPARSRHRVRRRGSGSR